MNGQRKSVISGGDKEQLEAWNNGGVTKEQMNGCSRNY
jgi:hypothetical protein